MGNSEKETRPKLVFYWASDVFLRFHLKIKNFRGKGYDWAAANMTSPSVG
jgi:hypothetical protein